MTKSDDAQQAEQAQAEQARQDQQVQQQAEAARLADERPDPATPSPNEVRENPETWAPGASHTIVHADPSAPQTDPLDESSPAVIRTGPPNDPATLAAPLTAEQVAAERVAEERAAAADDGRE